MKGSILKSEHDRELFRDMWNRGFTYAEIMSVFNMKTWLTVYNWRKRLKLLPRKNGRQSPKEKQRW